MTLENKTERRVLNIDVPDDVTEEQLKNIVADFKARKVGDRAPGVNVSLEKLPESVADTLFAHIEQMLGRYSDISDQLGKPVLGFAAHGSDLQYICTKAQNAVGRYVDGKLPITEVTRVAKQLLLLAQSIAIHDQHQPIAKPTGKPLEPWQERVVVERDELNVKIAALTASGRANTDSLLYRQLDLMQQYSATLDKRLALF